MSFWPLFFLEIRRLKTNLRIKLKSSSTYVMHTIFLLGAFLIYYSLDIFLLKIPVVLRDKILFELGINKLDFGAILTDFVLLVFILGALRGSLFRPTQTIMDKIDLDLNLSLAIRPKEVFMVKSLKSIISKTPALTILLFASLIPITEFARISLFGGILLFFGFLIFIFLYFYFTFAIYYLTRIGIAKIKYGITFIAGIAFFIGLYFLHRESISIINLFAPWTLLSYLYESVVGSRVITSVASWFFLLLFELLLTILLSLVFSSKYYREVEQFNLYYSTRINFRKSTTEWKILNFKGPRTLIFIKEFYQNARQSNFWVSMAVYLIFVSVWIYYVFLKIYSGPLLFITSIVEESFSLLSIILVNSQVMLFVMYLFTLLSFSVIDSFKKDIKDMWFIKSIPVDLKDLIWGKIYFNIFFASITVAPILILLVTTFLTDILIKLIFLSLIPFFVFLLATIEPYISIKYTPRRPIEEFPITGVIEYLTAFLTLSIPVVVLFMLTNVSIIIYFVALLINLKYCKTIASFFVNRTRRLIRIFQEF